jgi:hypothetical protein
MAQANASLAVLGSIVPVREVRERCSFSCKQLSWCDDGTPNASAARKSEPPYSIAGRRTPTHLFKDIRSASLARRRNVERNIKYHNFTYVKPGQLNQPHYSQDKYVWGPYYYTNPQNISSPSPKYITKRDLYLMAQEHLPPRTRRTYFCCRFCDPEGWVWARERNAMHKRELKRMLPGGKDAEGLLEELDAVEGDMALQGDEYGPNEPNESLAQLYCTEYRKDHEAGYGVLVDKAVQAWEERNVACSNKISKTRPSNASKLASTWGFVWVEDVLSDSDSDFDMMSDIL